MVLDNKKRERLPWPALQSYLLDSLSKNFHNCFALALALEKRAKPMEKVEHKHELQSRVKKEREALGEEKNTWLSFHMLSYFLDAKLYWHTLVISTPLFSLLFFATRMSNSWDSPEPTHANKRSTLSISCVLQCKGFGQAFLSLFFFLSFFPSLFGMKNVNPPSSLWSIFSLFLFPFSFSYSFFLGSSQLYLHF